MDDDVVESVPEPKDNPNKLSVGPFLEQGHPGELLPKSRELELMKRAAEKYVADHSNNPLARERVRAVWLQGQYQTAYHHYSPRPGKDPEPVTADDFG